MALVAYLSRWCAGHRKLLPYEKFSVWPHIFCDDCRKRGRKVKRFEVAE